MVQLYEHNKNTYENLIRLYADHNRVACVQPTGTGKSFIMLRLIEDNPDKKFLIASPSIYIFDQIKTHAEDNSVDISNCMFVTYQKIIYMGKEYVEGIEADYIILDEFHRLGSSEWGGTGVENLLKSHQDCKVLGTSATPIRYLDNMRNMAEEIFDGCYAVNMNLAEAIRRKILPLPVYVTAWYSFSGEIARLEERIATVDNPYLRNKLYNKIQKAKSMVIDTDCGLDSILHKHITNPNGKYIIFCPNVANLESARTDCSYWFEKVNKNINVYAVYTNGDNVKQQFEDFREDTSDNLKVLLCVDMLNEGIHVKDVDGVIMLRSTTSANVFYQQLGRALTCSNKHPVIFDLVNNFETGNTADEYASVMELGRQYNHGDSDMDITFEIYDYVRDIRELLDDISNTFELSWEATFDVLCDYVREYNRFPAYNEKYKDVSIGLWCKNQRSLYKNNKLPSERINALESIGFYWSSNDQEWHTNFNLLKQFKADNGYFPSIEDANSNKEVDHLYIWCRSQRAHYKKGTLSDERIELLNSIEYPLVMPSKDDIWDKKYEELKSIRDELGKFPLYEEIPDKSLKKWVAVQRKSFDDGVMEKDKISKLNELNFPWDRKEYIWKRQFEILEKFVNKFHRVPSSSEWFCDFGIGVWYRKQCSLMKNGELSSIQLEMFNSLDVEKVTLMESQWNKHFEQLKAFLNSYGRCPKSTELYEEFDLYGWVTVQKNKFLNNSLEEKYMKKFESINFDLENFSLDTYGDTWLKTFELLKEFISQHGRLPRSGEIYEGYPIYWWLNQQKNRFKKGTLQDRYCELFKSININLLEFALSVEDKWEINFNILKRFITENGRCPIKGDVFEGVPIYEWFLRQRKKYLNNALEPSQAKKLSDLGIDISRFTSRSNSRDTNWNENFELLEKYVNEKGTYPHSNELYCGVDLYKWLMKEKVRLKKYKLEDSRKEKLKSLGIDLEDFQDGRKQLWQKRFEQIKSFIDKYGRYPFSGEGYEDFSPYSWIMLQKRKLTGSKSDDEMIEKFRSIGIDLPNFTSSKPAE